MDDVTAAKWARGTVRAEMARRGMTYAALAAALRSRGLDENERNLRTKVARGTFSAAFFFQCMEAIGVGSLDLDVLELVPTMMKGKRGRDALTRGLDPIDIEESQGMLDEVQEVLDAGEKARRGE
jgi:hypothetical protein